MPKRSDYLSWDEYFMGVAMLSSYRSKDPNTQVGACIVNDAYDTKYPYVCHAELNAILNNAGANLAGCRIYVALFPCNECAKAIIQSGIREVVYLSDKYADTPMTKASKRMFRAAGVKLTKLEPKRSSIVIDFDESKV